MLRIGICDDDPKIRKSIYELACKVLFKYTELDFYYYRDGQEVISAIENRSFAAELLLLDIHMPGKDGIYVADYIRRNSIDVDIIFVTVSNGHVLQGYKYKAFAYCMKPINAAQLSEIIANYVEERQKNSYCINVSVNGQNIRIPLNRVVYFESQKRKIIAHLLGDDIAFYGKMNELEEALSKDKFFRCHQSYIVNRDLIDSIKRTEIIVSGVAIPMSRKYYEAMSDDEYEITESITITKSIAMNQDEKAAIIFVGGKLLGTIIRLYDGQKVTIGREAGKVDVIIDTDTVSRVHCTIKYDSLLNRYILNDVSKNGVFLGRNQRLAKEKDIELKSGDELWIGDEINRIRLG